MEAPLRVALIGYGMAGRVFHAPLIRAEPALNLTAIVTANPDRARQARLDNPDVDVLSSAEKVWMTASDFDLVVVASANVAHEEHARAALGAGLHVVVEKPLARDASTAAALLELAKHRHRQLHVFQNRRWDSDFLTVRELVEDGRLGRVHRLESRFERWVPQPQRRWRESPEPDQLGGLLYDLGSHLVDQAVQLLGPVSSVYAEMSSRRDTRAADDDVFVALRHQAGAISHLWASSLAARPGPRFRVLGSLGAYVVADRDTQEDRLGAGEAPTGQLWGHEPPERHGRLFPADVVVPTVPGAWPEYYARVADSLLGFGPAPVDPVGVVYALRVLDAARLSAQTREVVVP
jgi:scyllo-inositol 2-dehydrogenase (NADP+)